MKLSNKIKLAESLGKANGLSSAEVFKQIGDNGFDKIIPEWFGNSNYVEVNEDKEFKKNLMSYGIPENVADTYTAARDAGLAEIEMTTSNDPETKEWIKSDEIAEGFEELSKKK